MRHFSSTHSAEGSFPALRSLLGEDRLRTDAEALARWGRDSSSIDDVAPLAIAFPGSTEEVRGIVAIAREHRIGIVPSGGRTGLCGGACAPGRELVVSLDRMDRVLDFDPTDRLLHVEAGIVTARVQALARDEGLLYPVDFASAGSSQIGGNIATNAGGVRVIRHGMTRARVAGLVVVDGRGEVLRLNAGLVKNNTGPDLRHLFIGSEGMLGIITEAWLTLCPPDPPTQLMLLSHDTLDGVLAALRSFSDSMKISAFEFFSDNALEYVCAATGLARPLGAAPFYALLEYEREGPDGGDATAERAFETLHGEGALREGVRAGSEAQARALWRLREAISATLAPWKPWKNDVSVRVSRLPAFVAEAGDWLKAGFPALETVWYGHIGDGNIHLNVLRPDGMDGAAFERLCDPLALGIAGILRRHEGSVSAEHGIGLLKRAQLAATRPAAELAALRGMKSVFDPLGIMNPGKVLPEAG